MRAKDNGCFYSVTISTTDVMEFKTMWPCSGLPNKPLWAQFDKRNGDLVDLRPSNLEERGASGDAMVALIADGQAYAKKRLRIA